MSACEQQSGGSSSIPPTTGSAPSSSASEDGSTSSDGGVSTGTSGESDDGGSRAGGTSSDAAFVVSGGNHAVEQERDDDVVRAYLRARSGSDQLLATIGAGGTVLANRPAAHSLVGRSLPVPGGSRLVSIDGEAYVAAVQRAGAGEAVAAVPVAEAEAAVHQLLMAMLVVCAIALLPATLAAWWAARRALAPLSRIAHRASRVTAGDLSVRMGPVHTRDEIGEVSTAIDAMLERLQDAFDAQQRFIDDASHELRTPLTIARGHLETALPADVPAQVRDAVDIAIAEIDRMADLVDGLLGLSRGGRGNTPSVPVDMGRLAERVVERSRVLGGRRWTLDVDDGMIVSGDEGALEQVLLNLIRNAVKHTGEGDRIAVSAGRHGDRIRVEVRDRGEGIDPEVLPRVFGRFVRADDARSRSTGGAGLGLAICREIVERHGGTITADNAPDGGARFTIDLPAAAVPDAGVRTFSPASHV